MNKITLGKLKTLDQESLNSLALEYKIFDSTLTKNELISFLWSKIKKPNLSNNIERYYQELSNIKNNSNHNLEKKYNFITKDELLIIKDTDKNRDMLLKSVLKLVVKLSTFYTDRCNSIVSLDDIIQAGNIGAMVAVDIHMKRSYEERKKYDITFGTIASPWILKYIRLELNRHKQNESNIDDTIQVIDDSTININIEEIEQLEIKSKRIFECLTISEKNILFMNWGIGLDKPMTMRTISKHCNKSLGWVHNMVSVAEEKLSTKKEIIAEILQSDYDLAKISEFSLCYNDTYI